MGVPQNVMNQKLPEVLTLKNEMKDFLEVRGSRLGGMSGTNAMTEVDGMTLGQKENLMLNWQGLIAEVEKKNQNQLDRRGETIVIVIVKEVLAVVETKMI